MDRTRRVRLLSISTAAASLAALVIGVNASQAVDSGTTFDQTFSSVGETGLFLPEGVTAIDVVATGGRGASVSNINSNPVSTAVGGLGARVSGRLSNLTPGSELFLEVGGNGSPPDGSTHNPAPGGYNGGGSATVATTSSSHFFNVGGGGGGASDIRTATASDGLSPDTRLIVASGGGGGGHTVNSSTATGGNGGAGWSGSGAAGLGGAQGASSGGQGGHGASSSSGGGGGTTGGTAGTDGSLGQGGDGGSGPDNAPGGGGGGGGGGRFGGGGGAGGGTSTGGGGGGGGSSLIPAGGTIAVAPGGSNGSIEVSYSIPGTDIDSGPTGPINNATPSFSFSSADSGATFECRIDSNDDADFASCPASFTTSALADGQHTLDVRALNSMGNFDATPATRTFTVDTTPPTTTITSGPSGPTTSTTPTFTYTAEAGSTFDCGIDTAALASCPATGFTAPILAPGAHTFSVRATDAAGNVEATPATRSFTVTAAGQGGTKAKCKKKKHKRAVSAKKKKCKKKKKG
jgi:hypothetical protein